MGSSETLRSVIDAGRSSKRLDELSSARVIGKIAMQIHAAQQKAGAGKAVGPITPAHIKLAANGEAKLDLATAGSSLGYSSPEQTMGGFGDRRSDVFSLGTVLWEALTYQRLFDAMNDAAVRMAVQEREIQTPSEVNANVPAELSAICMRALNRNATDRYQSLKAMAVEIEEFLEEAGYADDDSKIATYLAAMTEPPKAVKIDIAPLARPASSTQPPPAAAPAKSPSGTQPPPNVTKPPAAPSMLGEPPSRPANPTGQALAAALANAGATPATSNGSTTTSATSMTTTSPGLAPVGPSSTAVGVPKLSEWQDGAAKTATPPPAAAPVVPVDAAAPASAPMTPMPPVLPSGSTPLRNDKSTISVSVPPQVKVATVEAKHAEAKQPAMIVDEKPKATIVEDKPQALIVEDKPQAKPAELVDDGRATIVDSKLPEIVVPKLVDGKLPEGALDAKADKPAPSTVETQPVAPVTPAAPKRPASQSEAAGKRPGSQAEGRKRSPSQGDGRKRSPSHADGLPQAAAAVSLPGGASRDSKDVLAGWGWGTDKHNAIAPEGYVHDDDDYDYHEPSSRKMLVKIIGAGMGAVLLIIIIAFAFGGSSDKKKTTASKQADTTKPLVDQPPAPPPEPAPAPPPQATGSQEAVAGSADGSAVAAAQPAEPTEAQKAEAAKAEAAKAEAAKAEAAKAEADRIAAEKEQAKQAELAKADAAKQEAARIAAEKEQAKQAELAKKEAAKQDAATKKAEAARIAAEKKAEAQRIAAEKAEARKAEQARIAAEKAEARKAEQARLAEAKKTQAARKAEAAKTQPKARPETKQPKAETKVAKAEPTGGGKVDVEATYRQGLQQFARGDTNGALASLRTALAANPNYAPTWRGLGLVFEKMGEKDQARVSYKRYLQLAPSAGDAEQIKGRLERLAP